MFSKEEKNLQTADFCRQNALVDNYWFCKIPISLPGIFSKNHLLSIVFLRSEKNLHHCNSRQHQILYANVSDKNYTAASFVDFIFEIERAALANQPWDKNL
jgi:hypothetical protein